MYATGAFALVEGLIHPYSSVAVSSIRKPTVAVFGSDPQRTERCVAFLDSARYESRSVADAWSLISMTRTANVKLVIVDVAGDASAQRPLIDALREGEQAPLVLLISDRNDLKGHDGVQVLVRPVSDNELTALVSALVRVRVTRDHMPVRRAGAVMAFDMVELLAYLWRDRRTAELLVNTQRGSVRIYLRDGAVIFADHDNISDTLGRRLLNRGVITAEQFSQAVDIIGEANRANNPMMLGEALLSLGHLDVVKLRAELSAQTGDRVATCCEAPPLGISLMEAAADIGDKTSLAPPTPSIMLAGIKHVPQVDVVRFLAPHAQGRPNITTPFWEIADKLGLDEGEASFVMSIDGKRTVESLRVVGPLQRRHLDQLLAVLIVCELASVETRSARCELIKRVLDGTAESLGSPRGVDSVARQPTPQPLEAPKEPGQARTGADSAVMGLMAPGEGLSRHGTSARRADSDSLDDSRGSLGSSGSSGSLSGSGSFEQATPAGIDSLGTGAFARLATGEVPAAVAANKPVDEKTAAKLRHRRLEAERYSQQGHAAWREDDFGEAQSAFAKAARLDPDAEEYVLHERWMSYQRKGRASKRRLDKLRRLAERVHRQQHDSALAHMVLGHIMRELGRPTRARQHLDLAESSDPSLPGLADERILLGT